MDIRIINTLLRQTRNKTFQASARKIHLSKQYTSILSGHSLVNSVNRQKVNSCILQYHTKNRSFCTHRSLQNEEKPKLDKPDGFGEVKLKDLKRKRKDPDGTPVGWIQLAALSGILVVCYATYRWVKAKKDAIRDANRKGEIGKSKIGGTFDLIDQDGNPKKSEDYHGKWVLLYFGFTHCPDICPDEMEKMSEVYDKLKEAKKTTNASYLGDVVPLMITVDPERDGVKQMKEYCKEFHPELIGLTGTPEKIMEACKAFRVYFSAGPRDDEDDYIVDHTIIIYLLDPEGQFVDYYGQTKTADQIVTSVKLQMGKYIAPRNAYL